MTKGFTDEDNVSYEGRLPSVSSTPYYDCSYSSTVLYHMYNIYCLLCTTNTVYIYMIYIYIYGRFI